MRFQDITFGESSAELESEKNPLLVSKGFYQYDSIIDKLLFSHEYLVLGNKGSGKSLIGAHIKTLEASESDGQTKFVTIESLKSFPYKLFSKIISGESEPESKHPLAWQWLLLVNMISSFYKDVKYDFDADPDLSRAIENFKKLGILQASGLPDLARICSNKGFKIKLAELEFDYNKAVTGVTEAHFSNIVSYLKKISENLKCNNGHYLIIDGLDEFLSDRENQYIAISSLISEAKDINKFYKDHKINAKIIILCRKDLFLKLPGPNKNKLSGYTVDLNWYQDQVEAKNKHLIKLVEFRAAFSGYNSDLFKENFAEKYETKNCIEYILENTRYTPRDIVQLLEYLKKYKTNSKFSKKEIESAIKDYSAAYFWHEVEDELDGYYNRDDIQELKIALIHFRKREFKLNEFVVFCEKNNYNINQLERIFDTLYNCGAISNMINTGPTPRFFSKMRDGNDFNKNIPINIHRGAWKALQLV